MQEGRLIAWLKNPGDPVHKGEAVAEIEGDKAAVELEATADGILAEILVQADTTVAVGTVLGRIRTAEADPTAAPAFSPAPARESVRDAVRSSPVAQRMAREHGIDLTIVGGSGNGGRITRSDVEAALSVPKRVLAAPAVRKLARDHQIDLKTVRATGKDGQVTRADVEALLTTAQPVVVPQPGPVANVPVPTPAVSQDGRREVSLSNMRQTIARRLVQSVQEAPHFFTSAELDFTPALAALPAGIGVNALLLYLTVKALQSQPELNATYENGHLFAYDHIHLAIAVALPQGLLTPVLHRADDYSLSGLADRSRDLISRARAGKLRPDELGGGTFTISNLGIVPQIQRFTAIINPPQIAILAIGAAKPRPVVIDGGLHVRTTAHLTLSADHRVIDGLIAARFLEAFDQNLQAFP